MKLATVVGRELRLLSRRKGYYVLRAIFLGLASGVYGLSLASDLTGNDQLNTSGLLAVIIFGFGGSVFVADAVSAERNEKTLGLLLLTPLRYRDVLLGKLVSGMLPLILCLIAIVPVMCLALLSGGVTWVAVLRLTLNVAAFMFLGVSVGIFWSTVCRDLRVSTMLSWLTLLGFSFLLVIFLSWIHAGLLANTPVFFLFDEGVFPRVVSGVFGWGLLVFFLALRAFRIVWFQETAASGSKRQPSRRRAASRRRSYSGTFWGNANPYRELAAIYSPAGKTIQVIMWSILALYFLVLSISLVKHLPPSGYFPWEPFWAVLLLEASFRWNMCLAAPKQIFNDRSSGFLEMVLITPVTEREVSAGIRKVSAQAHWWNSLGILICHAFQIGLMFLVAWLDWLLMVEHLMPIILFHLGFGVSIFFEGALMRRIGMYWGLRSANYMKAAAMLYLIFFFVPFIGVFFLIVIIYNNDMTFADHKVLVLVLILHALRLILPIILGIVATAKLNSLRTLIGR